MCAWVTMCSPGPPPPPQLCSCGTASNACCLHLVTLLHWSVCLSPRIVRPNTIQRESSAIRLEGSGYGFPDVGNMDGVVLLLSFLFQHPRLSFVETTSSPTATSQAYVKDRELWKHYIEFYRNLDPKSELSPKHLILGTNCLSPAQLWSFTEPLFPTGHFLIQGVLLVKKCRRRRCLLPSNRLRVPSTHPPSVTLQPPSRALQPPSVTLQPPSRTLHPPAVGYPPTAFACPPTAVGYPPTAFAYPPPTRRRLPSNRRRVPSNRRRLPSNRLRVPSTHPPSVTHQPPSRALQPPSVTLQTLAVAPHSPCPRHNPHSPHSRCPPPTPTAPGLPPTTHTAEVPPTQPTVTPPQPLSRPPVDPPGCSIPPVAGLQTMYEVVTQHHQTSNILADVEFLRTVVAMLRSDFLTQVGNWPQTRSVCVMPRG